MESFGKHSWYTMKSWATSNALLMCILVMVGKKSLHTAPHRTTHSTAQGEILQAQVGMHVLYVQADQSAHGHVDLGMVGRKLLQRTVKAT